MPDSAGKLTDEEKLHVQNWLNSHRKGGVAVCPVCGSQTWMVGENLVMPVTLKGKVTIDLGPGVGYPQVMLISNPCGYTMYFNAVMIGGLLPPVPDPEKKA